MIATIARDVTKDLAISAIRVPFASEARAIVRTEIDVRNEGVHAATIRLQVDVYRDTIRLAAHVTGDSYTHDAGPQTTATFLLNFTPSSAGRFLVHSIHLSATNKIPSNDERHQPVLVNKYHLHDRAQSVPSDEGT